MTRSRAFTSRWTNHLGSTVNTVQCKSLRRLLRLSCPFRLKFELWVSDDLLKQRLKLRAYAYSMMKGQCSIIKPSALFLYTWLVHIRPTTYKICMTNIPDPRNSWIWTIYARYTRTNEHSYWHTGHHVILLLHSKQHIWCPHGITTESIWFEQQKHRIHWRRNQAENMKSRHTIIIQIKQDVVFIWYLPHCLELFLGCLRFSNWLRISFQNSYPSLVES